MADRHPVGRGYPDPYMVATTKLSQEWSANRCVPQLNDEWLDSLLSDDRFGAIDPMVKVRLLLAGMLAMNQPAYQGNEDAAFQLQGALAKLQQAAATDADEWVKVMSAATGQLDGRLDLDAVMQQSAVVQETMTSLKQQVQDSTNQHLYPPLEELFLTRNPTSLNPDSGHFQLRQHPRVQPLDTSIGSYSNATPPPPALQSPKTGEQGAAFLRPQSRLPKQASLGRTESGTGADGATTVGRGINLKPGMAPRAPKIQLLGEAEQAEMSDVLQKSLKAKGHGVAASVRHEHVQGRKPRKAKGEQQPGDDGAGDAVLEAMELDSEDGQTQEAAAAVGVVRSGRQQQQQRQQQQRTGGYYGSAAAATGGGPSGGFNHSAAAAAAAAAREAAIDEEIDELFEVSPGDDDDDFIVKGYVESHISKSTKGLVRHPRGASEDVAAPAELQDEISDEPVGDNMDGVEQETITADTDVGGEARKGAGVGESGGGYAAAKRRRVIVEDEDDDD